MAYRNFLIKVGGYTIPDKFVQFDSYQVQQSVLDLDSYRDANGILHRTALAHRIVKVEFNTPYIRNDAFETVMASIRSKYTNASERKLSAEIYVPETNDYWVGDVYMPDVTTKIYKRDGDGFLYEPVRIAFIGY